MNIDEARRLEPGMKVKCPENEDAPSYIGVVVQGAREPQMDLLGDHFFWLTVRDEARGCEAVWPSNLVSTVVPLS